MQITKTTEQKSERALVPFKEQVRELPGKVGSFFTKSKKRALIITASVLIICVAVGVNWMLFGPGNTPASAEQTNKEENNKNGDAGNVNADVTEDGPDSFFAIAVTDRQRARDEAIEALQAIVENDETSSEERSVAAASISRIAGYIEAEANIETLVKSKGFEQCVAVVSEDAVSVVVGTEKSSSCRPEWTPVPCASPKRSSKHKVRSPNGQKTDLRLLFSLFS